ncbi:DUF6111 family protein [Rhodopila sp.]|uniref:DUF6111 family protein n=1 Tax=Rhodopila sp. TaxID=2480087 RepID=UPI003D0CA71B
MPRLIEIVLFLTPFIGFTVWRLVVPSDRVPAWLVACAAGAVMLILLLLLTLWHFDASDGGRAYIPARVQDGRVIPGHAAAP